MSQPVLARYGVRFDQSAADLRAAQALRHRCFHGAEGLDQDEFDAHCRHVLIEDADTGALVACFRLLHLSNGRHVQDSYSAQFYALDRLAGYSEPMMEIGRFCISPELTGPEGAAILRTAWAELTRVVEAEGIGMLFGCSSFQGTDASAYADSFALLRDNHLAPVSWRPGVKAAQVVAYAQDVTQAADPKPALAGLPPLLRTYLLMGGWVSDHAVVDHQMNTLHVFTGLEIKAVPPARAKLLRAIAAEAG